MAKIRLLHVSSGKRQWASSVRAVGAGLASVVLAAGLVACSDSSDSSDGAGGEESFSTPGPRLETGEFDQAAADAVTDLCEYLTAGRAEAFGYDFEYIRPTELSDSDRELMDDDAIKRYEKSMEHYKSCGACRTEVQGEDDYESLVEMVTISLSDENGNTFEPDEATSEYGSYQTVRSTVEGVQEFVLDGSNANSRSLIVPTTAGLLNVSLVSSKMDRDLVQKTALAFLEEIVVDDDTDNDRE